MAVTEEIAWGDGSGDKIYLTANAFEGDQTVLVSSDANTGATRTKTITFSATGVTPVTLTVSQTGRQQYTLTLYPSSYDTEHYSWSASSNISRGYTSATSTNYAEFYNGGRGAECYIYYKFDTSQIPDGATIDEVTCSAKVYANGNSNTTPTKAVQLFTGTAAKGTAGAMSSSVTTRTLDGGDWTLAEIRDARVRVYTNSSSSTTSTYFIRFYGATLTIKYTV